MNSAPPRQTDDDHHQDIALNCSAATLEVYEHERLAYTEIPLKNSKTGKRTAGKTALLKAIYCFVLSR